MTGTRLGEGSRRRMGSVYPGLGIGLAVVGGPGPTDQRAGHHHTDQRVQQRRGLGLPGPLLRTRHHRLRPCCDSAYQERDTFSQDL